uniref:Uncharacterized protein n=1 Tax=Caenorhabditis japonica TaxID=281687 RepID=A0A8R1DH61_CAEJA
MATSTDLIEEMRKTIAEKDQLLEQLNVKLLEQQKKLVIAQRAEELEKYKNAALKKSEENMFELQDLFIELDGEHLGLKSANMSCKIDLKKAQYECQKLREQNELVGRHMAEMEKENYILRLELFDERNKTSTIRYKARDADRLEHELQRREEDICKLLTVVDSLREQKEDIAKRISEEKEQEEGQEEEDEEEDDDEDDEKTVTDEKEVLKVEDLEESCEDEDSEYDEDEEESFEGEDEEESFEDEEDSDYDDEEEEDEDEEEEEESFDDVDPDDEKSLRKLVEDIFKLSIYF